MITKEERNSNILAHILEYCNRIESYLAKFGDSFESFMSEASYRDAVAMCVFQIGELSGRLSEDF